MKKRKAITLKCLSLAFLIFACQNPVNEDDTLKTIGEDVTASLLGKWSTTGTAQEEMIREYKQNNELIIYSNYSGHPSETTYYRYDVIGPYVYTIPESDIGQTEYWQMAHFKGDSLNFREYGYLFEGENKVIEGKWISSKAEGELAQVEEYWLTLNANNTSRVELTYEDSVYNSCEGTYLHHGDTLFVDCDIRIFNNFGSAYYYLNEGYLFLYHVRNQNYVRVKE